MQTNLNQGIGRGFKVSKEQIVGLVVALQRFMILDLDSMIVKEKEKAIYIAERLKGILHVKPETVFLDDVGFYARESG